MRLWGVWIRFYYKIDPDTLDEDQLIKLWCELKYCMDKLGILEKQNPA